MLKQLVVVQSDDAAKFQEAFNAKLRELQGCDPKYEFNHGKGYCAYIIYSDNSKLIGEVKPANHTVCDTCRRCQGIPGPHVKWRKCDIYGSITKENEPCNDYLSILS